VSLPHQEIVDWYRTFAVQPNMVISVFGDVDPASVSPEIEKDFHDVSSKPFQPGTVAQEGDFDGFREKWELGAGPTSTVTIAFNGPPAKSPDVPAIYVVASLLCALLAATQLTVFAASSLRDAFLDAGYTVDGVAGRLGAVSETTNAR